MKVRFFCYEDMSEVYEVDEGLSDSDLSDMACDWVADNVAGYYEVIDDDEYDAGRGYEYD